MYIFHNLLAVTSNSINVNKVQFFNKLPKAARNTSVSRLKSEVYNIWLFYIFFQIVFLD